MGDTGLSQKQLLVIIIGLILLNIVTLMVYVIKPFSLYNDHEIVASVGKKDITREKWLAELQSRYGKEILEELVDAEVIQQTAKRHNVSISAKDVEREYLFTKLTYSTKGISGSKSEEEWKQQIRTNIQLEEILTKDVTIPQSVLQHYYETNKQRFAIPQSYRISHIVTASKEEADQVIQELREGSAFDVLAMEKSLDEFSANAGGDLGYLTEESGQKAENYLDEVKLMKEHTWSQPITVTDGYAVIYLHEKVEEHQYSFSDVKKQIHRTLALEQMQMPVTGKIFWDESDVKWQYREDGK